MKVKKHIVKAQKHLRDAEDTDQTARRNMEEYNRMALIGSIKGKAENRSPKKKARLKAN